MVCSSCAIVGARLFRLVACELELVQLRVPGINFGLKRDNLGDLRPRIRDGRGADPVGAEVMTVPVICGYFFSNSALAFLRAANLFLHFLDQGVAFGETLQPDTPAPFY